MPRIGRQKGPQVTPPAHTAPQPTSLVAAAARVAIEGRGWRTFRFGDDSWQQECWRLYDIIGELRFAANWVGSACSRVRVYVAKVDKNGRVQEEVESKTKPKIAALADTLFGGPDAKAEALRTLGINLTVAGDCYIVGRGKPEDDLDEWMVVSCAELKRWGAHISYVYPDGTTERLDPDNDIVIRVWTPHPRRGLWPDSPTRAAMPMLWEIERLTRYVFAQIDSRLISAGLIPIPKELSFPDTDGEMTGAEALTDRLMRTGMASLKGEGTAAGVLPTFVEMPIEALGKIQNVDFSSVLSKEAMDLRTEAIKRFALAMDMAPEILLGSGDVNHWSEWHVSSENIKVHIEPLMTRICDALTKAYLKPALKTMHEDEDRYIFAYDTAPLTVRPQRLQDTLNLYDKGVVSRRTVLIEGDYKISDAPEPDEDLMRFTRELMLRDSNLFQIPAVRKVAGYTDEILPPDTVIPTQQTPGAGPPPPPAPPTGIVPTPAGLPPTESTAANALGGPGGVNAAPPSGITAGATVPPMTTFVVANATVVRALEMAGKKMLTPQQRGQWGDVPAHELHTRIRVSGEDHATRLLGSSLDHLNVLAEHLDLGVDAQQLRDTLHRYCMSLMCQEKPHHVNLLAEVLRDQGFLDGP